MQFEEDLEAWERNTGNDARLIMGNIVDPMQTAAPGSPVTLTCQLDDTFFDQFPRWAQYVTR
ncbi:hypothetical protein AB1286_30065 [Trinickia sp. NRRL B-1857]|uniref:hypothetical protein n=1 Tax=Trinickia sp. NRRL B-1857 TaxID=3162879 RepID=UPI003D2CAF9F